MVTVYFNKRHDGGILAGLVTRNHVSFPTMEAAQLWIHKAQEKPDLGLFRLYLGCYSPKNETGA